MVEPLMKAEREIARRLDIDPVYLQDVRFRRRHIEGFVCDALAFSTDRVIGVRFLKVPTGIVRPENPFRFVDHEVLADDVGAMITEGPTPIEPPPGWKVILLHDIDGKVLCTTVPPDEIEVIR